MNKSHVYLNAVLTVIAGLLAVIAFRLTPPAAPVSGSSAQSTAGRVIDVNIVGATKSLPVAVDFAELRGTPLAVSLGAAPLPVMIAGSSKDLPVVVTALPSPAAPTEVKIVGANDALQVTVKNQIDGGFRLVGPIDVNIAKVGDAEVRRGYVNVLVGNNVGVTGTVGVSGKVAVEGEVKVQASAIYNAEPIRVKVVQ